MIMCKKSQPQVGVGVIVKTPHGFPMLKRSGSHGSQTWCWPGGHLEHMESVIECAIREAREEVGLIMTSVQLLPWFTEDFFDTEGKHYITLYVYGESLGQAVIMEPDKAQALCHAHIEHVDLSSVVKEDGLFPGVAESWVRFRNTMTEKGINT